MSRTMCFRQRWCFLSSQPRSLCSISIAILRRSLWEIRLLILRGWHSLQWEFLGILASRFSCFLFRNLWILFYLYLNSLIWFHVPDIDFPGRNTYKLLCRVDSDSLKLKPSVISNDPTSPYYNKINLTLINVVLYCFGPLGEHTTTRILLGVQVFFSVVAVVLRYKFGSVFPVQIVKSVNAISGWNSLFNNASISFVWTYWEEN